MHFNQTPAMIKTAKEMELKFKLIWMYVAFAAIISTVTCGGDTSITMESFDNIVIDLIKCVYRMTEKVTKNKFTSNI